MHKENQRFILLDGIRGFAAIFVVFFHLYKAEPPLIKHEIHYAYLAVDLFFVLSGFVLTHTYWVQGIAKYNFKEFLIRRIIRLYPLFFLGTIFASAVEIYHLFTLKDVYFGKLINALLNLFFIPSLYKHQADSSLFINFAAWSLFYELLVNIFFAAFLVFIKNTKLLALLILISGAAYTTLSYYLGIEGGGFLFGTWYMGILRTLYSFGLGVLFHRLELHKKISLPPIIGIIIIALLSVIFLMPEVSVTFRLFMQMLCIPILVMFAVCTSTYKKLDKTFDFLGITSYALYILHAPIVGFYGEILNKYNIQPTYLLACLFVFSLIILCVILDKYYDIPVRRYLTSLMSNKKGKLFSFAK
ncbi:acyltransferase family protein [Pseudaquidulcibacter saccharophilus]|uniref:acyltransferase family protein n=1 Tax=Pseudaquidulcibacter saccharophilus TaxID=2831900 RepID=UPI001EFEF1D9